MIDPATHIATRAATSIAVPPIVFDPLSLIYYMRGFPLTVGKVLRFTISQTASSATSRRT